MASGAVRLSCALIGAPDLAAIDRLARIHLGVHRGGGELLLADAAYELVALINFAGLADVLTLEAKRKPEKRKEPGGVEKERELADPPVL